MKSQCSLGGAIPYETNTNGLVVLGEHTAGVPKKGFAVIIGDSFLSMTNSGYKSVIIGQNAGITTNYVENVVCIGSQSQTNYSSSIALGCYARTEKENQFVLGATQAPINEMKVVTSDGDKYIATTDQTVPTGGTKGQVLMKNSEADYDFSWTSLADYDEVSF